MSKSKRTSKKAKPSTAVETERRNIPLNRLVPSSENVRKSHSPESVAQLAASIAAHGLLQNLTVQPEQDDDSADTGNFAVTAGGRRLAALKLLVSREAIPEDASISCQVRTDGSAVELSLAENIEREALHPADEFEAFQAMQEEQRLSVGEIAARFGVTERLVRERLKLASVSPKLIDLYRAGEMTLEAIMAFTVCDDHARQEEVWEGSAFRPSPRAIREVLLEAHIPVSDPRLRFVGLDAYQAAGGPVVRDLFSEDDGGYLADPALLDRLVLDKLTAAVPAIAAEGWKWTLPVLDLPEERFGRVYAHDATLSDEQVQRMEDIEAELESLETEGLAEDDPMLTERHAALHEEYSGLEAASRVFDPADLVRSGALVTLDKDGLVRVIRGLVRPEDAEGEREDEADSEDADDDGETPDSRAGITPAIPRPKPELSDRLTANLTAHRTLALRDALAQRPGIALAALVHRLVLQVFYPGADRGPIDLSLHSAAMDRFVPNITRTVANERIEQRHADWVARLPRAAGDLWAFVLDLCPSDRDHLLAYCASLSINAVSEKASVVPGASADYLALALSLDITEYWRPTAISYFQHVPKDLILNAVREAKCEDAACQIADLRKLDMAQAAETLLEGTGWLPPILRLPVAAADASCAAEAEPIANAAE